MGKASSAFWLDQGACELRGWAEELRRTAGFLCDHTVLVGNENIVLSVLLCELLVGALAFRFRILGVRREGDGQSI